MARAARIYAVNTPPLTSNGGLTSAARQGCRRVGLWLIGACGGVGGTVALGLAALRHGLICPTSLTTELPAFKRLDLDGFSDFVIGGHDIRRSSLRQAVREMHERANVFQPYVIEQCLPTLDEWTANIRPGTAYHASAAIQKLADLPEVQRPENGRAAVERIQADLQGFRAEHRLE